MQDFLNAPKHGDDDDYADSWTAKFIVGMDDTIILKTALLKRKLLYVRPAQSILTTDRIDRIESYCRKDIPA